MVPAMWIASLAPMLPIPLRQEYLQSHFQAGVPLAGYFVWSLFDNFEWSFGYSQRFGIVWVNFATQQRILKDSARWYKDVISRNAL